MTRTFCLVAAVSIASMGIVPTKQSSGQPQQSGPSKKFINSIGMEFVWIPPGVFLMGSPKEEDGSRNDETQHQVTLTQGFYLGKHLVTQEQWRAVTGKNISHFQGHENLPVDSVSWADCQLFLEKLRDKEGRPYRLPTEAEWEYACRAGSKAAYGHGSDVKALDQFAWFHWNSEGKTHPVGQKRPNAWGLYDMHGNLWQWCADAYAEYPSSAVVDPNGRFADTGEIAHFIKKLGSLTFTERAAATNRLKEIGFPALAALQTAAKDPSDLETQRRCMQLVALIAEKGQYAVLRGGSHSVLPWTTRSAYRNYNEPTHRNENYGFRVALTPR